MKRKFLLLKFFSICFCLLFLAACSEQAVENATATPEAAESGVAQDSTPTLALTTPAESTIALTIEPSATMMPTIPPSVTPLPSATAGSADSPGMVINLDGYIDDRSDPIRVLASYFNVINQHEYARAYSYWRDPDRVGDFSAFQRGYADTAQVHLTVGGVSRDAGAGQYYSSVPVILVAEQTGGKPDQRFAGCYVLHLSQPAVQGIPPFRPLAIDSATIHEIDAGANLDALLAASCGVPGEPINSAAPNGPLDVSATLYIDNRSDPTALMRSYFNAINRHEYLRAFSYWEEDAMGTPYAEFEAGFADTDPIIIDIGDIFSGAAAGNTYYDVPVSLHVQTVGGDEQYFAGCYRLHLGSPGAQAVPPFRPMGIQTADIEVMADAAAASERLAQGCSQD